MIQKKEKLPLQNNTLRLMISGGGTGGHIFPAIAIANAVRQKVPTAEVLFVGAKGRMEMEKVPAAGYKIEGLWISGLQRRITWQNILFPIKVISSVYSSLRLIQKFKPDAVVGVGGYASGPLLYAATLKKIPTLIQEQNSFPGITNKLLAGRVSRICVAYENMSKFFPKDKIVITGNPVRQDIAEQKITQGEARKHFGLAENRKTVLVIGGSLGARTVNQGISECLNAVVSKGIQLIWQTGKAYVTTAKEHALPFESEVKVYDFISKMDYAYAAADLVVSRAGALSIAELMITKKPSILVPSPNVAEDHQTKNAMAVVNRNAAIMVKDNEAKIKLKATILQLMKNDAERKMLGTNIGMLAHLDAAGQIAAEVLNLIPSKNPHAN